MEVAYGVRTWDEGRGGGIAQATMTGTGVVEEARVNRQGKR